MLVCLNDKRGRLTSNHGEASAALYTIQIQIVSQLTMVLCWSTPASHWPTGPKQSRRYRSVAAWLAGTSAKPGGALGQLHHWSNPLRVARGVAVRSLYRPVYCPKNNLDNAQLLLAVAIFYSPFSACVFNAQPLSVGL